MKIQISMSTRDHAAYADGVYTDGKTIVKAGGMISKVFRGLDKIAAIRNDHNNVGDDGRILRDCEFNTPSEAAQFVNGNISNGYRVWRVDGEKLGDYLKRIGMKG